MQCCFPPSDRRIPDIGDKLSQAAQGALGELLRQLGPRSAETAVFPDGARRARFPAVVNVIADAPEVAHLIPARFGQKTNYPRPRCFTTA